MNETSDMLISPCMCSMFYVLIFIFTVTMKELLKKSFNEIYWANTFDIRHSDISKGMVAVSLKSNWPFLFTEQGVINIKTLFLHKIFEFKAYLS